MCVRSHSKTDAEAKEKAFTLSMEGVASKIECPLLVIAAGLDRLCPPEDAQRLARETKGKTELLLVEDGNHVAHNRFYKYRGQVRRLDGPAVGGVTTDWVTSPASRLGAFASLDVWTRLTLHCVYSQRGTLMKYPLALAAIVSTAAFVTVAIAAGFPPRVHYVGHDKVTAAFVKGERVLEEEGLIVIANRGVQRGAEIHATTNHVFIIQDGEAEFITGGKLIEPKEIERGQMRGTGIQGGTSHHLTKGDVITIPANTPHQWKDTSKTGSVGYFAVNFEIHGWFSFSAGSPLRRSRQGRGCLRQGRPHHRG